MQNPESLKLLFVINPVSGGEQKTDWENAIRSFFKETGHAIEFYLLTGKDDKVSVQHYIETLHPDTVVAVGGDGTVKMVAELVKDTPMALGIIPAGSANGMARELEIPLLPEEALKVLLEGRSKKIDAISINGEEICLHVSDMGLNALLVRKFEQSKKRGMWGYGRAIFGALWQVKKIKVTIRTDEATIMRRAYMVALANARKYGTGANINPDGDISDGKFEVVIVRKLHVFEILKAIFTERSFYPDRIEVLSTRELELQTRKKMPFQVDGEYKNKISHLQARILPGVIRVLIPVNTGTKF